MWAEIMGTIALIGSAISNALTDKSSHDSRKNAKETGKKTYVDGRGHWRFTETKERVNTYKCVDGGTYWYSASGLVQYKTGGREGDNEKAREDALMRKKDIYPHKGVLRNYWVELETGLPCMVFREYSEKDGDTEEETCYFGYLIDPDKPWYENNGYPYTVIKENFYDVREIDTMFFDVFLREHNIMFNTHVHRINEDYIIEKDAVCLNPWSELTEGDDKKIKDYISSLPKDSKFLITYRSEREIFTEWRIRKLETPVFFKNSYLLDSDYRKEINAFTTFRNGGAMEERIKSLFYDDVVAAPVYRTDWFGEKKSYGINIYTKVG